MSFLFYVAVAEITSIRRHRNVWPATDQYLRRLGIRLINAAVSLWPLESATKNGFLPLRPSMSGSAPWSSKNVTAGLFPLIAAA